MKSTIRIPQKHINKKIACIALAVIAFLASLMFYVDMQDNMDFIRIQELMQPLRQSDMSLSQYLFPEADNPLNRTMNYTFTFNTLMFISVRLFRNNYAFVWISAVIDYSILAYMIYDWTKARKCRIEEKVGIFLVSMAFLPFVHVCSGIRAAMASCLMALAVYGYLYREKNLLYFIVVSFLSVTVHPFAIYAIPVAILVKYAPKMSICVLVWLGTIGMIYIVQLLDGFNLPFISALAVKYSTYTASTQFTSYRSFFYSALLCSFLIIVYYALFYWPVFAGGFHKKDSNKYKLYTFIACYSGVILGSFGSYEISCRLAYVLGAFAPVIVEMITSGCRKDSWRYNIAMGLCIAILILATYTFSKHIRYYGGHFSLENIFLSTAGR